MWCTEWINCIHIYFPFVHVGKKVVIFFPFPFPFTLSLSLLLKHQILLLRPRPYSFPVEHEMRAQWKILPSFFPFLGFFHFACSACKCTVDYMRSTVLCIKTVCSHVHTSCVVLYALRLCLETQQQQLLQPELRIECTWWWSRLREREDAEFTHVESFSVVVVVVVHVKLECATRFTLISLLMLVH